MLVPVLRSLCIATMLSIAAVPSISAQATPEKTQAAQPSTPALDFSGVIFGNYQFRTDSAARAQTGGKSPNAFTIDRVYLTFRMPVGERASIRATTDIFQNAAAGSYYGGWTVRLKYGYLQYGVLQDIGGKAGFNLLGRIGMLHTVVVDHEEQFWPRSLGGTGVERFGFFTSADLGIATQLSLPDRWGEVYGAITNGNGYTSAETDRFKDASLRVTFTPLAAHAGLFQTLAISPWVYKGWSGSRFAAGGAGQVAPVTEGLARDRWGIFAGVRDPRLVLGAHYARRMDGYEAGANTGISPRIGADSTGNLLSLYAIAKPLQWTTGKNTQRLGALVRWDRFTPRTELSGSNDFLVAGVTWEPTARTALTLDYQGLTRSDYNIPSRAPAEQKAWFLHWAASF